MALRDHLGIVSATFGTAAALAGLAYTLTRSKSEEQKGFTRMVRSPGISEHAAEAYTERLAPYIEKGQKELEGKDLHQIQVETSLTWCGRACASAARGNLSDAREYAHEAVEHAALSGDYGLLQEIRNALDKYKVEL